MKVSSGQRIAAQNTAQPTSANTRQLPQETHKARREPSLCHAMADAGEAWPNVQVTPTGFEQSVKSPGKMHIAKQNSAENSALQSDFVSIAPELEFVINQWPKLDRDSGTRLMPIG